MLLTLTPNPALDRVLIVPGFRAAETCRIVEVRETAGGKGLNVTRSARVLGLPVRAIAPLGGMIGQRVADLAADEGLDVRWSWLASGETRTCQLVTDPAVPDTLTMNERGPEMSFEDWAAFSALAHGEAARAAVIASSGSLPPGVALEAFTALLRDLSHVPLMLDTSGAALAAALDLPLALLKANADEFGEASGVAIHSPAEALAVAKQVIERGPERVLVTLGAAGAVLAGHEGAWYARPPEVQALSPVGSGDATTAGAAAGLLRDLPPPEVLRLAVACGTANTLAPGPGVFHLYDVDAIARQVQIELLGGG